MTSLASAEDTERLQIRVHGDASLPTLIYLPGLHGDWTLVSSFREAVKGKVRFVEFIYPRTLEWSLDDYASEIENALQENGITNGWLLAESFGSQVGWELEKRVQENKSDFKIEGIILAGGFVRHPNRPGLAFAKRNFGKMPQPIFNQLLKGYAAYARFRHRHAPETLLHIDEFMARRTFADRMAMKHRLKLLAENDPRTVAERTRTPVFALAGFWDPIVPRWRTRRWLKKHCPTFHGAMTINSADHNVLGTQPEKSASIICRWIGQSGTHTQR